MVVEEAALYQALRDGVIGGAAIFDVFMPLADRIEHSERRANAVVETATDRMAEMIEKFDTHRTAREEDLEDRLRQSEERTAKRIEDALGSVQERMASVRSETEEALSPVQRAMSALADRLEAIEGRQAPLEVRGEQRGEEASSSSCARVRRRAGLACPHPKQPLWVEGPMWWFHLCLPHNLSCARVD